MATQKFTPLPEGWVDVPVSLLRAAPWNYKEDDEEKEGKLLENIRRNGQIETIAIRRLKNTYEIVNGNHRLGPFKALEFVAVHAYNTGDISLTKAKRLAVELNETRFPSDQLKLAGIIKDILKEDPIDDVVASMPYTEKEIENMLELTDVDWDKYNPGEVDMEADGEWTTVSFRVTDAQAEVINRAIDRITEALKFEGRTATGRAMELIAADSMNTPLESYQ